MVYDDLVARLNDRGYTNWLKASRCLVIVKDALHPFINGRMRDFHGGLLELGPRLRSPCASSCQPRGNQLVRVCAGCSQWQREILKHQRWPTTTINWDNCSPPSWRTNHWELAKAYMPRGQGKVKADKFDASALLNLINHCDCFSFVEPKPVMEMIKSRNKLMHSSQFNVSDEWMRNFRTTLNNFVKLFSQVTDMTTAQYQIIQMLTVDLSIRVSGWDQRDCAYAAEIPLPSEDMQETSVELISQWEAELLEESLTGLLHAAAAEDDTVTMEAEQLVRLRDFLQANPDLAERFPAELQALTALQARGEAY
ncbi:uncharacterized protein CXorf38 homolog isoform 1-T1 [Aulostomus maculatus]